MKKALAVNAVFSGFSGIILLLYSAEFAGFFAIRQAIPFVVTGTALIFFSLTIVYEIRRQSPLAILWIIIQDLLWVMGSIYLLIFNPFALSQNGLYAIAVVAAIVLLMAVNQAAYLAKFDGTGEKDIKKLAYSRTVAATKAKTWEVISDVGAYHKVAPNIDTVKIISGEGAGMIRSCSHGKDSWTETCSLWTEEKIYAFIVDTSAPDYPFPFTYLKGSWEVQPAGPAHTTIVMTFKFTYKRKIQPVFLHPLLRIKLKNIAGKLLDNWQAVLEKKETGEKILL